MACDMGYILKRLFMFFLELKSGSSILVMKKSRDRLTSSRVPRHIHLHPDSETLSGCLASKFVLCEVGVESESLTSP